ncbi:hypothetical protein FE257_006420 [Aspergillus nanangensis]|uniref:Xylanolytic transcriptional activator regulatory domain-containing protein n=1 Tax=Aspergillus nanangensis TaxID=2582783 RepID=A0AAD4GZA1_ASPNN|nr:hypothetical protein FE257_006420 [Aspergillus nanangensis]
MKVAPLPNEQRLLQNTPITPGISDSWIPINSLNTQLELPEEEFIDLPGLDLLSTPNQLWEEQFNNIDDGDVHSAHTDRPFFFHFLDTFTSETGFVSSFECLTPGQRQDVLASINRNQQNDACCHQENNALGVSSGWLNNPLSIQTHQILLLIKEVVTIKPRNSCVNISWSQDIENRCVRFFSPINLHKYIDLYWSIWSPNVNFLHRPSFDAACSKPILLACMAIIGACVSPDPDDSVDVRMWLNCVEEAAFADDDFNRDPISPFQPVRDIRKIQALQAAYMVCLYQNWEGTDTSKKRIRRHRFSTVVSIVRDIDITTARHINYSLQQKDEFDWKGFVAREELIRTFIWVFLMDTAFVTFNNLPPRMVAKEMKMHMAVPESCFQAPTACACFDAIRRWMPSTSFCGKVSFRTLFERLCLDSFTLDMQESVAALGPLNLFTIISGIHSLVFQYQSFFSAGHLLLRTYNALQNFKAIWNLYQTTMVGNMPHTTVDENQLTTENMWQRVGFCRHAGDFWLLAKIKVDRLSATDAVPNNPSVDQADGDEIEPSDSILNKYDQTSMRQVNDLISDFQSVHLGEAVLDTSYSFL